jgi:hypothetical protein
MNDTPEETSRGDRREQPTSPWAVFLPGGRRLRHRRAVEHRQAYFVDRFSCWTFVLVLLLLSATIADGVLTLHLLDSGGEEINPLMDRVIQEGATAFLLCKYALTAAGLPILLVFQNHYLFRTRFRVGYLLPAFVGLYAILLTYQLHLCILVAG